MKILSADVVLGSLVIPLTSFVPGEVVAKDFRLEHARSGTLRLQILFVQDAAVTTSAKRTERGLKALSTSLKKSMNIGDGNFSGASSIMSSSSAGNLLVEKATMRKVSGDYSMVESKSRGSINSMAFDADEALGMNIS